MSNASKSGRDGAYAGVVATLTSAVFTHYGWDPLFIGPVTGAATFGVALGWRVVRHYLPWIDDA